jgi:hypothetical protein
MQGADVWVVPEAGLLGLFSAGEEKNNKLSSPCCYQFDLAYVTVSDIVAVW